MPVLPGMPRAGEPNIWRARAEAIFAVMNVLKDRLAEEITAGQVDRRSALLAGLLDRLQQFGDKHFRFFEDGFAVEPQRIELENPLSDLQVPSVEYVFGTILQQIANDITILQRIQEQRKTASGNERRLLLDQLDRADKLAYVALQQLRPFLSDQGEFGQFGSTPQKTTAHSVLSYFHLSAHTRVLPYAPVALIGIPLSAIRVKRDLLAIPHELGHYLYWHGNVNSALETTHQSLRFNVKKNIATVSGQEGTQSMSRAATVSSATPAMVEQHPWLLPWAEEFFADVVSCLLAGPIAALYFQDMLLQTRLDWMYMDDGTYPAAAIRPYIFSETFSALFPDREIGKQLEARWEAKLQERGIKEVAFFPYVNPYLEDDSPYIHHEVTPPELRIQAVPAVKEIMRTVTSQVMELVGNTTLIAAINQVWHTNPWYLDLGDLDLSGHADVERAYALFDEHVEQLIGHFDGDPAFDLNIQLPDHSWFELLKQLHITDDVGPGVVLDRIQQAMAAISQWHGTSAAEVGQKPVLIPAAVWKPILEFAGWTTEGPTDGNLSS